MERDDYVAVPQVPSLHYVEGYDTAKRWSSYWIQIEQALSMPEGPILEVGVGNGLVTEYLRHIGNKNVTTLDIDPELEPDIIGDILDLPFEDGAFECVMACEVLEHMPFEKSAQALIEMRRVASRAIVSIPNSGWCAQMAVSSRYKSRIFRFSIPWIRKLPQPKVVKEHYWELEMEGFPERRFRDAITAAGWNIEDHIRNANNLYHHFFFLK